MSPKLLSKLFIATLLIFIFCTSILFCLQYNSLLNIKKNQAEKNSRKIYSVITENFDYTEQLMVFMGKQIARHDKAQDLDFIHKMFLNISQLELARDNLFSWSKFDWVDKNNQQTVNLATGIEKDNPHDMSPRTYTREARLDPWKLKFVEPVFGYPSNVYVIPAGVGIINQNKNYLGLIAVGIDINNLTSKINAHLNLGDQFILIGSDQFNFILGSLDLGLDKDSKDIKELTKQLQIKPINPSGALSNSINFQNINYIYSLDIKKYPYIILTGYDAKIFWQEFCALFMPNFTELLFITLLIESFILIYRKKLIKKIQISHSS